MKHIICIFFLLLFVSFESFGQDKHEHKPETVHFKKAARAKRAQLLAEYPKVAHVEFKSVKTARERHKMVDKAWHDLWHNFTEYYHQKGLYFKRKKLVYIHLHFSETGHLDYFGYRFKGSQNDQTRQFVSLFKEYIKDHDFAISEGVKFSHTGELHLLPNKGVKEGL